MTALVGFPKPEETTRLHVTGRLVRQIPAPFSAFDALAYNCPRNTSSAVTWLLLGYPNPLSFTCFHAVPDAKTMPCDTDCSSRTGPCAATDPPRSKSATTVTSLSVMRPFLISATSSPPCLNELHPTTRALSGTPHAASIMTKVCPGSRNSKADTHQELSLAECRLCISHSPSSVNCGCDEGCYDVILARYRGMRIFYHGSASRAIPHFQVQTHPEARGCCVSGHADVS